MARQSLTRGAEKKVPERRANWSPYSAPACHSWGRMRCPDGVKIVLACGLILCILTASYYGCCGATDVQAGMAEADSASERHSKVGCAEDVVLLPSDVLECFQVHQPVWTSTGWNTKTVSRDGEEEERKEREVKQEDEGEEVPFARLQVPSCSLLLMEHSFGWSYGHPFIGYYEPPPCSFNRVTMNLTVTSRGRQFDRLALMYLNDTEVFRTSTAEPTVNGIIWTYTKDMSSYLSLWTSPQKIIFDLGNLVDDTYTGLFNATLTANFFTGDDLDAAHLILPLSASRSTSNISSHFTLPETRALTILTLPRNSNRALVSLAVAGQAAEEFWWSNVPSPYTMTFDPTVGALYGFSPFRQAVLYIDSRLAGLVAPFPVIFTGGVVPALWRPMAGPDAFDLRNAHIDISPFLGLLSDGHPHTFEIKIAGLDEDTLVDQVGQNWFVSGKILLWLDPDPAAVTTGDPPTIAAPPPILVQQQQLTLDRTGNNATLIYDTTVQRTLSISALVHSQRGTRSAQWTQSTHFQHRSQLSQHGKRQVVDFHSVDSSASASSATTNTYALLTDTTMTFTPSDPRSNLTIDATLTLSAKTVTSSSIPSSARGNTSSDISSSGSSSSTVLEGEGFYFSSPSTKTGLSFGRTKQAFKAVEGGGEAALGYEREVEVVNGTVIADEETWTEGGARRVEVLVGVAGAVDGDAVFRHVRARKMLGRGPGRV